MRLKSRSSGGPSSANSFSQVDAIRTRWIEVCNFFAKVQCIETEREMNKLSAKLPAIEKHLDFITEGLSQERKEWLRGVGHACMSQTRMWHPSVADSVSRSRISEEPPSPVIYRGTSQELDTNESSRSPEAPSQDLRASDTTLFLLPPCYFYLFGDFTLHLPYDEDPSPLPVRGGNNQTSNVDLTMHNKDDNSEDGDSSMDSSKIPLEPSVASTADPLLTIGPLFLLMLCMYAKHNQPVGARLVILRFLTRLLNEVDVPPCLHVQYAHLYPSSAPRSVLQITPETSIVPLLDMIRCVGRDLAPTSGVRQVETLEKWHSSSVSDASRFRNSRPANSSRTEDQATNVAMERLEFVRFLCALAEKMEQVPDLANFFITTKDGAVEGTTYGADQPPEAGGPVAKPAEILELLRELLPYLVLDAAASDCEQRRDTSRFALSAIVSLAKCPDPWVQDIVAAEGAIADRTLLGAGHTLITLCKIQGNDDSEVQRDYLLDVLKFWSALTVSAPVVASQLRLVERIEKEFVQTALVPLLMSPDSIAYAAACLLTSTFLDELNSFAPAVTTAFGSVLLASVVHVSNGRRCEDVPDYYTYWVAAHERECARGAHNSVVSTDLYTSFFNFYILPHLTTTSVLSDESRITKDSRRLSFTEWTATEASLVLIKSMAENLPVMFLKYVLLLDVRTLTNVWKRFNPEHAEPHVEGSRRMRGWFATTFAPLIEVNDCFTSYLRTVNKRVCGITDEQLAQEVLERMLRIESNAPLNYLHQRQLAEGSFFQDFPDLPASSSGQREDVPNERQDIEESSSMIADDTDRDASFTLAKDARASEMQVDPDKTRNAWFDEGPHQAPLIISLSRILLKLLDLPYRVHIILTQTLITICLLPDLRVLYTLMDSDHGRLYHSLRVLRDSVHKLLDGDNKASLVMANVMVADSNGKETSKRKGGTSRDNDQGAGIDTKSSSSTSLPRASEFPTLIFLYNTYLEHWDCLPRPALWDCDDLGGHPAPDRPLPALLPEEVGKALINNQSFLETCAVLEMLRLELSAVVGYMTLSHSLLNLQPGKT
ncbi:unnamed protein product [Phytomonas sp. EM1]|nr:unnamed protein product [Phytomonas sp. EM1]|eukprot:CCW60966.1 unnamed protein product [Phytomonas sp. isolate EM1]